MIIKGDLERMAEGSGHPGGSLKTMLDVMEVPSHARHLLLQLNSQRTKGFLCDVIIVVQNALFRAHKNILAASSLYLKSLVVHDNLINLDHEMVSPGVFRVILDYIYTGRLNECDQASGSESNLGAVLAAASYLQLLDLVALCRKKLKRNGKYHHLRPTHGFAPYTKIGVGGAGRYRMSTPVIQSCFPGGVLNRPPQSEELPPHPLVTHVGEMYAPPSSQVPQIYPAPPPPTLPLLPQTNLRSSGPERDCSPLYGLDLSKKSPESHSQTTQPHPALSHALLNHEEGPHSPAPPGTNGGPAHQGNDSVFSGEGETDEYKSHPHLVTRLPHLHRSDSRGQDPYPGPPSAGSEPGGEGGGVGGEQGSETGKVYRWVKPEPLPYPAEDEEEDDEEEDEEEEGGGGDRGKETNHRHHNHHKNGEEQKLGGSGRPGYGSVGCEGEDEKSGGSASEETGSSEGRPSPIFHMPYEPESFGDNLYVCIPCDKGFPSSEQLNAHVETHTEEELYVHTVNELGSSNGHGASGGSLPANSNPITNNLSAPLGLGVGSGVGVGTGSGEPIRPYRCSSCDKSYKDPATLRQHEKSHWLTRPYPCSICGKKFTQRGTMTRHMRSHLGLKPFACDACGMRFTRQYRLTEHMRIHSGEKPYECQVCGGKFAQQRNLISHMKMHSGGGGAADGKLKMDFADGIYPLGKYAEHLGLKPEKASLLLAQASQHLLADTKAMESMYPLTKLANEHLGIIHDKMEALRQPLGPPPTSQHLSSEPRAIDRYSPS